MSEEMQVTPWDLFENLERVRELMKELAGYRKILARGNIKLGTFIKYSAKYMGTIRAAKECGLISREEEKLHIGEYFYFTRIN
ncbi:MAG: hypothetical protein KKF68_03245 [Nanoarchaeota archaeon]|nr:hypothetical protein [Nanoarchaeota archaeon]